MFLLIPLNKGGVECVRRDLVLKCLGSKHSKIPDVCEMSHKEWSTEKVQLLEFSLISRKRCVVGKHFLIQPSFYYLFSKSQQFLSCTFRKSENIRKNESCFTFFIKHSFISSKLFI